MPYKDCKRFFNEVYDSTYITVLNYINSRCSNMSDTEDIVQDVYLDFYKRIKKHGFSDIGSVEAFLIFISKKKLAKYYAEKYGKTGSMLDVPLDFEREAADNGSIADHEQKLIDEMMLEKLWDDIAAEGECVLKIFRMKIIMGMTFDKISSETGLPESTVKTKFYRTVNKLKSKYREFFK